MYKPGIDGPPRNPREWVETPIAAPEGVDATSAEALVATLKAEGFLKADAPVALDGMPDRLKCAFLSGVLIGARKYGAPLLVDPLEDIKLEPDETDLSERYASAQVGEPYAGYKAFDAELIVNANHKWIARTDFTLWSEDHWIQAENFTRGAGVHEVFHKAQTANGPELWMSVEARVAEAVGDWKAPFTNSFRSSGLAFDWSISPYGKRSHKERDAVAIQLYEHGCRDEFVVAIHDVYAAAYKPGVALSTEAVGRTRDRSRSLVPLPRVNIGERWTGAASTKRGERIQVGKQWMGAYYFRCEDRRFLLNQGLLVDVDRSKAAGRLISARFKDAGRAFEIETGLPLMNTREDIPEEFVPGCITEAIRAYDVQGSQDFRFGETHSVDTDLVTSIDRDLLPIRNQFVALVADTKASSSDPTSAFSVEWQPRPRVSLGDAWACCPGAGSTRIRSSEGFKVLADVGGTYMVIRDPNAPAAKYPRIQVRDEYEAASGIVLGEPIRLVDTRGKTHDLGRAEEISFLESSVLPRVEVAAALESRDMASNRSAAPVMGGR